MRAWGKLRRDERGAVAPTVALSLVALIAAGGLAFDYAHMATLDTELQQAADQAALAGATQLDGQSGAIERATAAAKGLLTNQTLLANDSDPDGRSVTIPTVVFYKTKADAEAETNGFNDITKFAEAHFVRVAIKARKAFYAMTPIVGAFTSGNMDAGAVAGLGSAICKVPPVMMCNPNEPIGNGNPDYPFDPDSLSGYGIRLVGNGSYEPGNWGFLQNDASSLLEALGYNNPPGKCVEYTGVDTKTGVNASVMDGLNTRFDIDANGNSCPGGNSNCSPALNVRKDLVRGNQCGITGNGWQENPSNSGNFDTQAYKPLTSAAYPSTKTPQIMGHPRDICHAFGDTAAGTGCNVRVGNGVWDINAYWRSNYGTNYASEVSTVTYGAQPLGYPSRYQVYRWESDNYTTKLNPKAVAGSNSAYSRPVAGTCLATANAPYGIVPGTTTVDRRRISMAVVNCKALNVQGHEINLQVLKWADVFLIEPSISRSNCTTGKGCNTKYSDKTDIYVEMIGETKGGAAGATAGQVVRRDTPYLVK